MLLIAAVNIFVCFTGTECSMVYTCHCTLPTQHDGVLYLQLDQPLETADICHILGLYYCYACL